MTTHIFFVDSRTFRLHLEYLFVGTGARNSMIDFNSRATTSLSPQSENGLVSMIADGFRVRRGDSIIFYLQQNIGSSIFKGKFFGIFKAKHNWAFLDNNDGRQYLANELGKSLSFRTLIEPEAVYAEGVTEWEALEENKNIIPLRQLLWNLIYWKLKSHRSNAMLPIYEAECLAQLIRSKNRRIDLDADGKTLSFDAQTQRIVPLDTREPRAYTGRQEEIDLLPRLLAKFERGQSFESHLQAYITRSLGMRTNPSLDSALLNLAEVEWLGNEVPSGVGMQRIEAMASVLRGDQREVVPIKLKSREARTENIVQIQRYVDWVELNYISSRPSDIRPVLIARRTDNKTSAGFQRFTRAVASFNQANMTGTYPLKYVEFYVDDGDLHFEEYPL